MATRHPHLTVRRCFAHTIGILFAAAVLPASELRVPRRHEREAPARLRLARQALPPPAPVRGSFGDPRIGGRSHSFHFGVDIVPRRDTVYATVTGRAYISPRHPEQCP